MRPVRPLPLAFCIFPGWGGLSRHGLRDSVPGVSRISPFSRGIRRESCEAVCLINDVNVAALVLTSWQAPCTGCTLHPTRSKIHRPVLKRSLHNPVVPENVEYRHHGTIKAHIPPAVGTQDTNYWGQVREENGKRDCNAFMSIENRHLPLWEGPSC